MVFYKVVTTLFSYLYYLCVYMMYRKYTKKNIYFKILKIKINLHATATNCVIVVKVYIIMKVDHLIFTKYFTWSNVWYNIHNVFFYFVWIEWNEIKYLHIWRLKSYVILCCCSKPLRVLVYMIVNADVLLLTLILYVWNWNKRESQFKALSCNHPSWQMISRHKKYWESKRCHFWNKATVSLLFNFNASWYATDIISFVNWLGQQHDRLIMS